MTSKKYTRVLTIAGSDSGGGAGIQADLKTFSALGCYGMSVITALTAQNTETVAGIQAAEPEFVVQQIDAVLDDIGTDAIKIGMLFSAEIIEAVAERLKAYKSDSIVLDPVMISKSGAQLLKEDAVETMVEQLFPIALLITPNIPEAEKLTGIDIGTEDDMKRAAEILFDTGAQNVLIKGGHMNGDQSKDMLFCNRDGKTDTYVFASKRINTKNTHGTGCTYSSAIASYLAHDCDLENAVKFAKQYVKGAIEEGASYKTGSGHGPLNHFFDVWNR
ncbi:bifunctional hydroxymethylpyrimidine kinase/phosphomethylpyrimidine kinase [Rhodohalobacter sp. 8-1]|uniref:bifunctional hydroxymethylpyrimidine kinase/phosphomethylpyrimidine kinase n=1 Tax=Rhodohalobacter sp. 8-1 TaxID=3131972 RepID=UPI0030EE8792